jgi:hypothetical protein
MPYKEVNYPIYGLVVYLNAFAGGEIEYSLQQIKYAPKPGDLIIHSAQNYCRHFVHPVVKGPRYSYSNAIYKKIKIPVESDYAI